MNFRIAITIANMKSWLACNVNMPQRKHEISKPGELSLALNP